MGTECQMMWDFSLDVFKLGGGDSYMSLRID
jgi:hypothetical protein